MKITRSQLSRIIKEEITSVKSRGLLKEMPDYRGFVTAREGFNTAEYNAEIRGEIFEAACIDYVERHVEMLKVFEAACINYVEKLKIDEPDVNLEMAVETLLGEVEEFTGFNVEAELCSRMRGEVKDITEQMLSGALPFTGFEEEGSEEEGSEEEGSEEEGSDYDPQDKDLEDYEDYEEPVGWRG